MTRAPRLLRALASLRLTPLALLALAGAALLDYRDPGAPAVWMAAPLALLAANLGAALLVEPRLRRRVPLLVFHVALLAVLVLATAAELLRFEGRVEVLDGAVFAADAVLVDRVGPLHRREWLDAVRFAQRGFSVEYQRDLEPAATRALLDADDPAGPVEVGSTRPLARAGYRFHTTSNKGFAALVEWRDAGGATLGAVHFPSWPLHDWRQVARWNTPVGEVLELELDVPHRADDTRAFVLESRQAPRGVTVTVRDAHGRRLATLAPGASLALGAARLSLVDLRMWMGYRVGFDPLLAWLLSAALVGAAALALHFAGGLGVADRSAVSAAPDGGRAHA